MAASRMDAGAVSLASSGGEDYELLLTCDPRDGDDIIKAIGRTGSRARAIGEIVEDKSIRLVDSNGEECPMPASWEHF